MPGERGETGGRREDEREVRKQLSSRAYRVEFGGTAPLLRGIATTTTGSGVAGPVCVVGIVDGGTAPQRL